MVMTAVKEERFEVNPASTGITEQDGRGTNWWDIWDFKVSLNQVVILRPTDVFSCYLVGDDAAAMPNATKVRVVKRDVANEDSIPILPVVNYKQAQEFADKNLQMHLRALGGVMEVVAEEHIVVQVSGADATGTGDTDASASHFKIFCTRRRKSL